MTATFNPSFAEVLSEAFSNCGIRPSAATTDHIDEAIRSANLLLVSFSNRGVKQYQLQYRTQTMTSGATSFTLPADVLDVWAATIQRDGQETPLWPIARTDYMNIPKKTQSGRIFNYFVDKGKEGTTARVVYVWPVADRSTDVFNYWAWVRNSDENLMEQLSPMSYEWLDAYASELAARLAWKFAPDRVEKLQARADRSFLEARYADRERAPTRFKMRGYVRPRTY
jgi:hypothetical protein